MKQLLILSLLFAENLQAQSVLTFDKRFVECENQWVAFQRSKDSTLPYGFIYIDAQAGLTLNYEGSFTISSDGTFIPKKVADSTVGSVKIRLLPNQVKVAIIPAAKFTELQIAAIPEWLKGYQTDTNSVERLYRWGFLYNSWDESAKALTYLERAQAINPAFNGLETELGYAYNALQRYDKADSVLERALQATQNTCYLYKELSFSQVHLGQLAKAAETCKKGIATCPDKATKAEIAYNLTYQYFIAKDKGHFAVWAAETKKWATQGDRFSINVQKMESTMDNPK
jgi:tetratricopeptide (TPR) repeat protein